MSPMGQNPAYGGATTGQAPGDLRNVLGQPRTTDAKKKPAGPKRTYGSTTPGKARPESREAAYEDSRTYGSSTKEKGTPAAADGSAGQRPAYSETTGGQVPSASKDGTRGERRTQGRETDAQVSSESNKEAPAGQRHDPEAGKTKRASETGSVPQADTSGNAIRKQVPSGKKESPKDPYEGIKLN